MMRNPMARVLGLLLLGLVSFAMLLPDRTAAASVDRQVAAHSPALCPMPVAANARIAPMPVTPRRSAIERARTIADQRRAMFCFNPLDPLTR